MSSLNSEKNKGPQSIEMDYNKRHVMTRDEDGELENTKGKES